MRNKETTKTELQKKVHKRICVRHFTFLIACPPFYVIFCCLLRLLPFPSDALAGWLQQKHTLLWVVFCVMSKIWRHFPIFPGYFQNMLFSSFSSVCGHPVKNFAKLSEIHEMEFFSIFSILLEHFWNFMKN